MAKTEPFTELQTRRLGPIRRWFAQHPRGTDIVVMCWYLVPALTTGAIATTLGAGPAGPLTYGLTLAITSVALLQRRRWPVQVLAVTVACAVLCTVVTGNSQGHEFASVLAIYAVASLRSTRTSWICTLGAIAVLGGVTYLLGDTGQLVLEDETGQPLDRRAGLAFVAAFTAVWAFVGQAIGMSVRARRQHERGLVERAHQLALERDQREQLATVAERARIAREMHDVVAHSVSVMVALADGAAASLDKRPDRTRLALDRLSETGRDALAEMRQILGVLREENLGDGPFSSEAPLAPTTGDLDELLARYRTAGLPVERVDTGPPLPAHRGLALTVYRVVQESLTNVLRYAQGTTAVRVEIAYTDDRVVVTVDNDAGSGRVEPGSGHGLVGLRERVAAHSGTVEAGPHGTGWRVRATIRVEEER